MPPGNGKTMRAVERVDDAGEADARVLDHLARLGCDPSAPREAHHYLYLPDQGGAEAVALALGADGWSTSVALDGIPPPAVLLPRPALQAPIDGHPVALAQILGAELRLPVPRRDPDEVRAAVLRAPVDRQEEACDLLFLTHVAELDVRGE